MKNINEIKKTAELLNKILDKCVLCPHKCRVSRTQGEKGFCSAGYLPFISSAMPHHGEEPPISGYGGSGTIFFSYCNMRCVYCQNYQISQEYEGQVISIEKLASLMLKLQQMGCHNINFVSPTIWTPQILNALYIAKSKSLKIPLVYNTGGYDSVRIIKMLDGIIDIYMPDARYGSDEMAEKYSGVKNYVKNNQESLKEMYRQVGDLKLNSKGVAEKGLLIRLLVLPGNIGEIKKTLDFIKNELSINIYLSIMAQYHPEYKAYNFFELSRNITSGEYYEIVKYAEKLGFSSGWTQDYISLSGEEDLFRPDFKRKKVFKYYED
ncbi:MAG: radical SAM protein [Actinobacteria bacterium]|nr:radical SAM protein [Actinomycetota bacterium]